MTQLQLLLMRARVVDWLDVTSMRPPVTVFLTNAHYGDLVVYEDNIYFIPYFLSDYETEDVRKLWEGAQGPAELFEVSVPLTWDTLMLKGPYEAPWGTSEWYQASMFILTTFTGTVDDERSQCSGT